MFRAKVFELLLTEGKIQPDVVQQMLTWRHSGFSVDRSVFVSAGDSAGAERLIQYFVRCPFSLARMVNVTSEGQVLYRAEHDAPQKFPFPADADLTGGVKRNFQVFTPLDFLAEVTQHIPDKGTHLVRYYGHYSNKNRGMRAKALGQAPAAQADTEADTPYKTLCRMRWAALIRRVYEVDPLLCPQCGGDMEIVSFITDRQPEVIRAILKHCGSWEDHQARAPPQPPDGPKEVQYLDFDAFLHEDAATYLTEI